MKQVMLLCGLLVLAGTHSYAGECERISKNQFIVKNQSHLARDLGSTDLRDFVKAMQEKNGGARVFLHSVRTKVEFPAFSQKETLFHSQTQYVFKNGDFEEVETVGTSHFFFLNRLGNLLTNHLVARSFQGEWRAYDEPLRNPEANVVRHENTFLEAPVILVDQTSGELLAEALANDQVQAVLQELRNGLSKTAPAGAVRSELLVAAQSAERCGQSEFKSTLYLGGDFPKYALCGTGCYVDFVHDFGKLELNFVKDENTREYTLSSIEQKLRAVPLACAVLNAKCFE